ncbi:hypothetical protein FOZ60_000080 [Perkinsus olseni]|uniref:C2 domain-containing protein n=1 Tax=Perkinsus olseni TaxID=32597 RepID=A0A7J6PNK5_PEROL|nr:hypothetical protein FOZ60_000080 [Perkinsus olseni]
MSYQYNAVKVEVRYARNLHDTEFFGKMDPYCVVELGKGKKFKTKVQKDVGSNPTWNETTILQYGMEPEMMFKVMDKESIKDDDFVGSATVSMAAVASAGRWSGDLALYRSKDKPAGSLSVAITMLPETAAPMMSGGPPVVTATVMGGGPPPPAMMMPGMQQQQQPVTATVISSGAPSAPYAGGCSLWGVRSSAVPAAAAARSLRVSGPAGLHANGCSADSGSNGRGGVWCSTDVWPSAGRHSYVP